MAEVAWVTAAGVAEHLGTIEDTDPRLTDVVAASDAWCKRKRRDLATTVLPGGDVQLAAKLYAAYLFRLRTSPQGLPSEDPYGNYETGDSMGAIYALLGKPKPVAR